MPRRSRQRSLRIQPLERRNLLAAHLSELLVDPLFGSNDTTQMIELRGEPSATLNEGTYLVVAEEHGFKYGNIHGIFDLSGQSFGENGYLVLLQQDSPHQPEAGATVLQSTAVGFGGLPDGIYSDSHSLSDRIDFIIGGNGYFLIESGVAPQLGQNIDVNEDSIPDPEADGIWNVLDSISLHPFVGRGSRAMGKIVFAEVGATAPEIATQVGAPMVPTSGFGYAGRVGESVGSSFLDWVASTTQDEAKSGDPPRWALADNLFGESSQFAFAGRDLDHVGGPNFVGGVRGYVTDVSGPVSGYEIFADTNENGLRDNLSFTFDPNDIVEQVINESGEQSSYPLINSFPGVTATKFSLDSFASSAVTAEQERDFPDKLQNRIFATGGISWFSEGGVLRFDFYEPINAASIISVGSDNSLSPVVAKLEAYDREGNLLAETSGARILDSQRTSLSLETGEDNISYVFAYSDQDESHDGGPFGRFDRLEFSQHERSGITDENGYYEITNLFPESYLIRPVEANFLATPVPHEVSRYEHTRADFGFGENRPPVIEDGAFNLSDDTPAGAIIGKLDASDPDGHATTFSFDGVVSDFSIHPETGVIKVAEGAQFDAVTNPTLSLTVVVQDEFGLKTSATATLTVTNINASPKLVTETVTVAENSGGQLGQLAVEDLDDAQTHTFELIGGSGKDVVRILNDGRIYAIRDVPLNFEEGAVYSLEVRVTDSGTPALSDTAIVNLVLTDVNEPPMLAPGPLVFNENATGVLGNLQATDPDEGQSLTYALVGGSATEIIDVSDSGEITLLPGKRLDYESQDSYSMIIDVSDSGDPQQVRRSFMLMTVNDVDEAPRFRSQVVRQNVFSGQRFLFDLPNDAIEDHDGRGWTLGASAGGGDLPPWLNWDPTGLRISGIPTSLYVGTIEVGLHVSPLDDPDVVISTTFELEIGISNRPLHNFVSRADVNGDLAVTPIDALQVINFLGRFENPLVDAATRLDGFFDTSGDNQVTPGDALFVLNEIARSLAGVGGEQSLVAPLSTSHSKLNDDAIRQLLADPTLF